MICVSAKEKIHVVLESVPDPKLKITDPDPFNANQEFWIRILNRIRVLPQLHDGKKPNFFSCFGAKMGLKL